MHHRINVRTGNRNDFVDITADVQRVLQQSGTTDGVCHVFVTHTTAGITINENADPDVKTDIISTLDRVFPWSGGYRHSEGNSAAHIKASLMGFAVTVPVENGRLVLGTWQSVYFCEFDGPRNRTVVVTALER